MSANAPWSVKGIDAKAREVAKDLARRSGMTLGEWLNQMILEGEDVSALISHEEARSQGLRDHREDTPRGAPYAEPSKTGGRMARNDPPRRPAAAYSAASQPLSGRNQSRRAAFDGRYEDAYDAENQHYDTAASDLGRVARALESLGARIEASETRSASAVRGVSHAVESVLDRLERSEATFAETRDQMEDQTQGVLSSFERLGRTEAEQEAVARRLEQAERLIDAQAERLEGLSAHARDDRERVAKFAEALQSPQAMETVRAVEGALGKLANQMYEGEARTRDSLKDMRDSMVGLSHRVAQVEQNDPDRAAQVLIDKVVAQLAQRLEAAEAQTSGAIRTLETAFQALDGRVNRVEENGDLSNPEDARSLSGLAADLSRRVEDSRQDLLNALQAGKQETIELAVKVVGERLDQAEKQASGAIEKMGHEVLRIADNLNRRMGGIETTTHSGLTRVTRDLKRVVEHVDSRFEKGDTRHAQALERLGGEIARISERLGTRQTESERRTAQLLGDVGEQLETQRANMRDDLSERIRQSEERTAKLLEETRARLDSRLAQVQTHSLLKGQGLQDTGQKPRTVQDRNLPNPFATSDESADPETPQADAPQAAADNVPDLTSRLLEPVTSFVKSETAPAFKPEFDPFEDDGDVDTDTLMTAPLKTAAPEPAAFMDSPTEPVTQATAKDPFSAPDFNDDDDNDPFAGIEPSRKTSPRTAAFAESQPQAVLRSDAPDTLSFDDDNDTPLTLSTRDALAAARAAVRASIEGTDTKRGKYDPGLGALKSAPARSQTSRIDTHQASGGNTLMNTVKASSIAMGVAAVLVGGWVVTNKLASDTQKQTPMVASALTVTEASQQNDPARQAVLKTRYDVALQALEARDPKAVDTLKLVANQGYAPAQYKLALLYNGEGKLMPVDKTEAREWVKRAAEGGLAAAMYDYGSMYYNGVGGAQDRPTAAMWFRKAAERGIIDSQYNLATLYQRGDGVPLNPTEAYKWMRIAANNGDKGAQDAVKDLAGQLSEAQLAKANEAVSRFVAITDQAPVVSAGAETASADPKS
ncbi:MAG: hypothetical protein WBQ60_01290 [Asticcacaulis sp.]